MYEVCKNDTTSKLPHRLGLSLACCVLIVFLFGLLMVFDTSSAEALDFKQSSETHLALIRQLLYALIGVILSFAIWFIGYKNLLLFSPPLLIVLAIFLILVFVPKIGQEVNGAHRWIRFGSYTFQPSEFVKIVLPLYFIYSINKMRQSRYKLILNLAIMGIPLFLVLIEPANGTAAVIGVTLMSLLILTKMDWRVWALPLIIVMIIGGVCALNMPHVRNRIMAYKNPEQDILGKGHQPFQARIATGSGGVLGRGFGKSMQKLHYLPEAQNDYIAAIFAEELGFVGILMLIGLYMAICSLGFCIAIFSKDRRGYYLAASLTFLISIQAFLNLAVVSGLLPSTGLNLPFFSQGGTSLITNMIALTILLNIAWDKNEANT